MSPEIIRSDGTRLMGHTVNASSGWQLKLEPSDLNYVMIDHSIRLRFDEALVTLENDFVLRADGREYHLDPEELWVSARCSRCTPTH